MSKCFVCRQEMNREWLCNCCFPDVEKRTVDCITIRQPWAELILSGRKTIELRNWDILEYTDKLYIHIGCVVVGKLCEQFGLDFREMLTTRGTIAGYMEIDSKKHYKDLAEFNEDKDKHQATEYYKYGFVLKNVRRLKHPVQDVKGQVKIFKY